MQLILPPYPTYAIEQEVYTEHNGQTVKWTTAPFSKMNFEEDRAMFKHINGYWASLPMSAQDRIFELYIAIANTFDTFSEDTDFDSELTELVAELFKFHGLTKIRHWAQFNSDIVFPQYPQLPVAYVETTAQKDKNHTREKTYTVGDYVDLVCMILQLRIMIPIWGRYIATTGKTAGTLFKEYYAFKLLDDSDFVREAPVSKLYGYIKSVLPAEGNKADILRGISSQESSLWNMSLLIVRKLCLADIRGLDPTPILIRHISRHIMEKAKRADPSTDMSVRDKKESSNASQTEENQTSQLEQYKIKEDISRGDIEFLLYNVSNIYAVANTIYPGIPIDDVDNALKAQDALLQHPANPAQTLLLMWMIDRVVPAETVSFMSATERARCLCACSAAYWAKGHYLLAALATATPVNTDGEISLSGTDSKGRLSKETLEKLEKLFPYYRKTKGNKIIRDEILAIDNLIAAFAEETWILNLSEEQMKVIHPKQSQIRRLALPHNFKELTALLVIDIASTPMPSLTNIDPMKLINV